MIAGFMLGIFVGAGATLLIMSILIGGSLAQHDDTPRLTSPPRLPRT